MKQHDYLHIFDKYIRNEATHEEMRLLYDGLKEDRQFSAWAARQWESVSPEMDPSLRRELLSKIKSQLDIPAAVHTMPSTGRKKNKRLLTRWVAAAIFLLLIGTNIYFFNESKNDFADTIVAVDRGQKANITLPDGTKVWINSGSEVTYGKNFNGKERVVSLNGEAFFDVVPDRQRTFTVHTGGIAVKVLGTSFNIKSYDDEEDIYIALMTGKVDVQSDEGRITMAPHQLTVYNKSDRRMQSHHVADSWEYASWKDNTLSFNPETFENIARILERHYNTTILFESEALKSQRFRGTLKNTSLESVLQVLSLTSPLTYEVKDSLIILRENSQQRQEYERALK